MRCEGPHCETPAQRFFSILHDTSKESSLISFCPHCLKSCTDYVATLIRDGEAREMTEAEAVVMFIMER